MVRLNAELESAGTGAASENLNNVITGPLLCGKKLFQGARSTQHTKRPLLYGVENLANQITVFVWRVHLPSFQEAVTSGAHGESSLEQVGLTGEISPFHSKCPGRGFECNGLP